ncbi:MAG: PQQ-binding-like beta-propeller repeat protein, partial [Anaerolineae bacterium]|nr:PQQ-binding-like beta-propeller repeat protein [Anaerolineae bacterium]
RAGERRSRAALWIIYLGGWHGGSVYIGGVDGQLCCLDARTGDLRWQYCADGPITAAPVVVGGVVYCGSLDHYVYAIPA